MKRLCLILMICLISSMSSAVVLLNDTWADSSRAETNLPTESATWVSDSTLLTVAPGSFAFTQDGSSNRMWTYFTPDGSPASLSVGQQLVATIQFTPNGLYANDSKSFRFCLGTDPTSPQVLNDNNDDGGGDGDPLGDVTAYGVFLPLSNSDTESSNASVGKHTNLVSQTSLMGSSSAWTMTSGGADTIVTDGAMLTMTLVMDYVAIDQMDIIFTLADAGGVISTTSISDTTDLVTSFDLLYFRFSKNVETADVLDFNSLTVEIIPEPATMALLGLGGLFAFRKKR